MLTDLASVMTYLNPDLAHSYHRATVPFIYAISTVDACPVCQYL